MASHHSTASVAPTQPQQNQLQYFNNNNYYRYHFSYHLSSLGMLFSFVSGLFIAMSIISKDL